MQNLLFVTIDDYLALSAWPIYDDIVITPNMDALQARSANFTQAYADVAVCNPSRAALLTGQTPWDTGVFNNTQELSAQIDLNAQTLPGMLQSAGMYTAIGGKVFHNFRGDDQAIVSDEVLDSTGLRNSNSAEFEQIQHVAYGGTTRVLGDDTLSDSVTDFLNDYSAETPFALFAGIYRPHVDWIIPQEYIDMYDGIDIPLPDFVDTSERAAFENRLRFSFHEDVLEANAWHDLVKHYLASMTYADAKLGEMLAALENSGNADDTVVVVMSDHGYHLGDAGLWHKFTTYEQSTRVPLVIDVPGEAAQDIDVPVNLSNVAATVLDLLEMAPTGNMQPSLAPYLNGAEPTGNEFAVTWSGASVSVRSEHYRYTRYELGDDELYDMRTDVFSQDNLIDELPAIAAAHRDMADAAVPGDLFIRPDGPVTGSAGNSFYIFGPTSVEITDEGGIDTVMVAADYTLPDDLENLDGRLTTTGLTLRGNARDNRVAGTSRADELFGLAGADRIIANSGDDVAHGGDGDDFISGVNGNDRLLGNNGNDRLEGDAGNDNLQGGDGEDYLDGGSGDDQLTGGRGDDILDGGANIDILDGGSGADRLIGGQGADTIFGGLGLDTAVFGGNRADYVLTAGGVRSFEISGRDGPDRLVSVERLEFDDGLMTVEEFFNPGGVVTFIPKGLLLQGSTSGGQIEAGNGDDVIEASSGADTVNLRAGADQLIGAAEDHFGDTINDFSTDDKIVFENLIFARSQLSLDSGTGALRIDTDNDGTADGVIQLNGDFSGGEFVAVSLRGDTTVSFNPYLPTLTEDKALKSSQVNGIANEAFLEGDGETDFVLNVRNMGAADYKNTIGVYEIDSEGTMLDARILVTNVQGADLEPVLIKGINAGHKLGFFVVQNGAKWAGGLSEDDEFEFKDLAGNTANMDDGRNTKLHVNDVAQNLTIFHSFADYLNSDGLEHAVSGIEEGGTALTIGFEDLVGGGDRDYQDVVFTIERIEIDTFIF